MQAIPLESKLVHTHDSAVFVHVDRVVQQQGIGKRHVHVGDIVRAGHFAGAIHARFAVHHDDGGERILRLQQRAQLGRSLGDVIIE